MSTRRVAVLAAVFAALLQAVSAPVTPNQASVAARNWLRRGHGLERKMGTEVEAVRTLAGTNGAALHVVAVKGGGFVVLGSDTEDRPVVAVSAHGSGEPDERNPLWALLRQDMEARIRAKAEKRRMLRASAGPKAAAGTSPRERWAKLLEQDDADGQTPNRRVLLSAANGWTSVADVRVSALVESAWSQEDYRNYGLKTGDDICYNYYTPNHWPCGCVATAGAQVMRYHAYPTAAVVAGTYGCEQNGSSVSLTMLGGTYDWDAMTLVPANGCSATSREAIGRLTYDVGVSVGMSYWSGGSSASAYMLAKRFVDRFQYANAVSVIFQTGFYRGGGYPYSLDRFKAAVIPNFDAGLPVVLGISGMGGHAVVGDGYGYSDGDFFVHINLGWANMDNGNVWYTPPDIERYTSIDSIVYNIYPTGASGASLVSGRVLSPEGSPVEGVSVKALSGGVQSAAATSGAKGIYTLKVQPGDCLIVAEKDGKSVSNLVTVASCVSPRVDDSGSYWDDVRPRIGNVCDCDLTLGVEGTPEPPPPENLTWYTTKAEAFAAAEASGKRILLVYGRDTCGNTTATRNSTCEDAEVKAKLLAGYVLWYSNCDTQSSESGKYLVNFDGYLPGVTVIDPELDKGIVGTSGYLNVSGMLALLEAAENWEPPEPPGNDDFADAAELAGASGSVTATNEGATPESGEPLLRSYSSATTTVWWKWTASAAGSVTFDTVGSAFDTVMGVYSGPALQSLTTIAQDDDGGGGRVSKCTFGCTAGATYYVCIGGYSASSGDICLQWALTASEEPLVPSDVVTVTGVATAGTYSAAITMDGRYQLTSAGLPDWVESMELDVGGSHQTLSSSVRFNITSLISGTGTIAFRMKENTGATRSADWMIVGADGTASIDVTIVQTGGQPDIRPGDHPYYVTQGAWYTIRQKAVADPGPGTILEWEVAEHVVSGSGLASSHPVADKGWYDIYRDGVKIDTVFGTNGYRDLWAKAGEVHAYVVYGYFGSGVVTDAREIRCPMNYSLTVSPTNVTATAEGGEAEISVCALKDEWSNRLWADQPANWKAKTDSPWVTLVNDAGNGESVLKIRVATNDSEVVRSAVVTVAPEQVWGLAEDIIVSQEARSEEPPPPTNLTWYTTKAEAFAAAEASGRRILLVYGRDTCGNTTATRNSTCEDAEVKAKLLAGYVLWYSNCDTQSSESRKYLKNFEGILPGVSVIDPALDRSIAGVGGYQDVAAMLALLEAAENCVSPHTVTFDLGEYGTRSGGGEVVQEVAYAGTAVAPEVVCDESTGMYFAGWDAGFSCVTEELVVHALYCPVGVWADGNYTQQVGDYTWSFTIADGEVTIGVVDDSGNTKWQRAVEPAPVGAVAVPSMLGGCPVTGVGYCAFENCSKMTSVELPSTVREIGSYAFWYCSDLADAGLPDSLGSIDYGAFGYCTGLSSVSIPSGVTYIGSEAFWGCDQLETVVFAGDKDQIEIGVGAFQGTPYNENLPFRMIVNDGALVDIEGCPPAMLEIPSGVTRIGSQTFYNCATLQSVTVPAEVAWIDYSAFGACANLKAVYFKGNAPSEYVASDVYCDSPSVTNYVREGSAGWTDPGTVELPELWPVDGGDCARPIRLWSDEPAITYAVRFDLGEHVVRTGGGAMEQRVIGGTAAAAPEVEAEGGYVFVGWSREFDCVTKDIVVSALYKRGGALGDGHYTEEVGGYTWSYTIADGGATIEHGNRQWQRAIEPYPSGAVEIPSELGGWPVTGIGYCAFCYCSQMTSVRIPASVRAIGSYAFYGTALSSIVIPANVQTLESYAFAGDLSSVCFEGNAPEAIDLRIYGNAPETLTTFVRLGSTGWLAPGCEALPEAWPMPDPWCGEIRRPILTWATYPHPCFRVVFDPGEGATHVGGGELLQVIAEGGDAEAPTLSVKPGYEFIGWSAEFQNVTEALYVVARYRRDGKLTDGWNHTEQINGYTWTFSVIDGKAIIGKTDINGNGLSQRAVEPSPVGAVEIPSELGGWPVSEIGSYAFYDCSRMTSVAIPPGVTSVGECAFCYCSGLTSVTIPSSVTAIGRAFIGCSALQAVAFEGDEPNYLGDTSQLGPTSTVVLVRSESAGWREDDGRLLATWPRGVEMPCQVRVWNGTMAEHAIVYELGRSGVNSSDNPVFYNDALLPLKLSAPSREGYAFAGWNLDGRKVLEIPAGTTGDIVLTAMWDETPAAPGWGWSDGVRQWRYTKVQYTDNGTTKTGARISNNGLCAVSPLPHGALTVPATIDGYPVVEADEFAFADCTGLTSVVLPSCFVGNYLTAKVFAGCENLTSVSVAEGGFSGLYNVQNGLLLYRDDWLVLCPPGLANPVIPETVQTLGDAAFYENREMRRIAIPEGIDEISYECFTDCENLSEIICPQTMTSFVRNPFKGTAWEAAQGDFTVMNGVLLGYRGEKTDLVIPTTVRRINDEAFQSRQGIVSVDLPPSVERIGDYAFYYCSNLARMTGGDGLVQVGQDVMRGTALWNDVPEGLIMACGWVVACKGMVPDELVIPADVRGIADSVFAGNENLKTVTYLGNPSDIIIGRGAFYGTSYEAAAYPFLDSPITANAQALATGKLLFVLSGADWCPWTTVVKKYLRWLCDDFFDRFVVYYCNVDTDTYGMSWGVPSYGVFDPAQFNVNWYDGCLASASGGVEERVQKVIDDALAAYGQGAEEPLTWYTTKKEAFSVAKAAGKRILLVYGRDTCGNTTATRSSTCEDAEVKAKLLAGYVLWYSNCDTQSSESGKYLMNFEGILPGVSVIDPSFDKSIAGTGGYQDVAAMLALLEAAENYEPSTPVPMPESVDVPEPEPFATVDDPTPSETDVTPVTNVTSALSYSGYLTNDAAEVVGLVTVKVAKKGKVSATVQLQQGTQALKKFSYAAEAEMPLSDSGTATLTCKKNNGTMELSVGAKVVSGTVEQDGAQYGFTGCLATKNELKSVDALNGRVWSVVLAPPTNDVPHALMNGYSYLTVTAAKQGKVKVTGFLADGTKVSVTAQGMVFGADCVVVPVNAALYSGKAGGFSMKLQIRDGKLAVCNASEWTAVIGKQQKEKITWRGCYVADSSKFALADGSAFYLDAVRIPLNDIVVASADDELTLPQGVSVTVYGNKWQLPKAGKVALEKNAQAVNELQVDKFGDNPSGLKLTYTAKTGAFKGSFALYQDASKDGKPKLKKVSVTVNGAVVNGIGYGSAVIKKVGAMPVVIGKEP